MLTGSITTTVRNFEIVSDRFNVSSSLNYELKDVCYPHHIGLDWSVKNSFQNSLLLNFTWMIIVTVYFTSATRRNSPRTVVMWGTLRTCEDVTPHAGLSDRFQCWQGIVIFVGEAPRFSPRSLVGHWPVCGGVPCRAWKALSALQSNLQNSLKIPYFNGCKMHFFTF